MGDVFEGRCHCGAVRFDVTLLGGLEKATRSNDPYALMGGNVMLTARRKDLKVYKGFDALKIYTYGDHDAHHYFCGVCGIHTHQQLISHPEWYGVNAGALEGLSPFDFEVVPIIDGQRGKGIGGVKAVADQVGSLMYKVEFRKRDQSDLPRYDD